MPTRGLMMYMLLLLSCARGFKSLSVRPDCLTFHQDMTLKVVSPTTEKIQSLFGHISEAMDDGTKVKALKLPDSHMEGSQENRRQLHPEG